MIDNKTIKELLRKLRAQSKQKQQEFRYLCGESDQDQFATATLALTENIENSTNDNDALFEERLNQFFPDEET